MLVARVIVAAAGVALAASGGAHAQLVCGASGKDAGIADISSVASFGSGVYGFAFTLVNVGTAPIDVDPNQPTHPGEATNVYRLTPDGVVSQVGMSWVRHEFFALESGSLCTCTPVGGGDLGQGCQSPTSASSSATQSAMGPRSQANPVTGFIGLLAGGSGFGTADRRVTIAPADLDPASRYFVEVISLTPGETERMNNASWRAYAYTGSTFAATAPVVRGQPAIQALASEGYTIAAVDVAGDGRFVLASRAVDMGGGSYRYDYALFNQHSDRGAGTFSVPLPPGAETGDLAFRDVAYFGEAYDGTDWNGCGGCDDTAVWSTAPFETNPNANALRWGTAYTFSFEFNGGPALGTAQIGLFKPGAQTSVDVAAVIPANPCPADLDGDGVVGASDLAALLGAWGGAGPADVNGDGSVNAADLAALLGAWGPC